jgi:hypothetical protein
MKIGDLKSNKKNGQPPAGKPPAVDCLTLPGGRRITRDQLRQAHFSLPPTCSMGDPPWRRIGLRLFPVVDPAGECVAEVWFVWKDGMPHLGRTPFINNFEEPLRHDVYGLVGQAVYEKNWAVLDAFHPEALPWYCRNCKQIYAESAWKIFEKFEDDGWRDSYRGFCPEGHERMIAD